MLSSQRQKLRFQDQGVVLSRLFDVPAIGELLAPEFFYDWH